jgi:hypothetical protein
VSDNHIIDHSTAINNWTEAETRTNIAAFQGWLAEGGPGSLKVFDFSGHVFAPETVYGEDTEMQRYWADLTRQPHGLEFTAILKDVVWDRQFYDLIQLGFGKRWADLYYDKEGGKNRWYIRPQWGLLDQLHASLTERHPSEHLRLHARTATMQAAWHVLHAAAIKHGLEGELPELHNMIWCRIDNDIDAGGGVNSGNVERSDYVKQHGSKLGHGKKRF